MDVCRDSRVLDARQCQCLQEMLAVPIKLSGIK